MIWKRIELLIVLTLLLAATAGSQNPPSPGGDPDAPASSPSKPLPGLDDPAVSGARVEETYIIGPNDVLNIDVFHDRDLTKLYLVSTDGTISLPLFGEMKAEGLTKGQLQRQLTETLSEQFLDPKVTVGVYQVGSKLYTITGSVKRPGQVPLVRKTTVFEAVNAASFLDNFSNRTKILILRGNQTFRFNYNDYLKGKNREKNIELQNGDTIVVQ